MLEYGWLSWNDIGLMLNHVGEDADQRKVRLVGCALVRQLADRITDERVLTLLEAVEGHVDYHINRVQLKRLRLQVGEYLRELGIAVMSDPAACREWDLNGRWPDETDEEVAERWHRSGVERHPQASVARLVKTVSDPRKLQPWQVEQLSIAVWKWLDPAADDGARRAVHADLVRDIFGNPFRPVAFAPAWRTEAVVAVARTMYELRDFGPMPVLADAIDDAGCGDADVPAHCRGPGPHVRGCWVVDLVLGKA